MGRPTIRTAVIAATKFMILTGGRSGEVLRLRWSDIDLDRRTARLTDTATRFSTRALPTVACTMLRTLDAVADRTMKLMEPTDLNWASERAQPRLRSDQPDIGSRLDYVIAPAAMPEG